MPLLTAAVSLLTWYICTSSTQYSTRYQRNCPYIQMSLIEMSDMRLISVTIPKDGVNSWNI